LAEFEMYRPGELRISESPFGPELAIDRAWSSQLTSLCEDKKIMSLVLLRLSKIERPNLDFLTDVPWLKQFTLLDQAIDDIEGIHHLRELRSIGMSDYSKKPIDFSRFPHLQKCYIEFVKGRSSVGSCTSLERLSLQHYSFKDLSPLSALSRLEKLWFSQGSLGNISDIGAFPRLTDLSLMLLRNLRDISPLSTLKHIERLNLQKSKGFNQLDSLATLSSLRTLSIVDCGEIESLTPLEDCRNLEELHFGGDTTIVDGDLSVLTRLPNLKEVLFRTRRSYNLRGEDIPAYHSYRSPSPC